MGVKETPAMIRVILTPAQRDELRARTHRPDVTPRVRDRLEMIRLSDAGWSIPRIAGHLGCHEQTVRRHVAAFLAAGFAALAALLDAGGRTWTTRQLAAWLEGEQGVRVHPDHLSRLLHARGFGWKRTLSSVAHKRRDPDAYAAKAAELDALKKRRRPG
jgi:hypothetical protein